MRGVASRVYKVCIDCNHNFVEPQPTDAELAGIYSTGYFHSWGDDHQTAERLKRETAREILAPLKNRGKILDCGAAYGAQLQAAQELGFTPYASERNCEVEDILTARFGKGRVFTEPFETTDFLKEDPEQFSVITMFDFIEHVQDPNAVFQKARSLLGVGGTLIVTTPNTDTLSARLMQGKWPHRIEQHLHLFSRKSMSDALAVAGFVSVDIKPLKKTYMLSYLHNQLVRYGPKIGTLVTGPAKFVFRKPLKISTGDMLVVASF